jgi:hypothetical protein
VAGRTATITGRSATAPTWPDDSSPPLQLAPNNEQPDASNPHVVAIRTSESIPCRDALQLVHLYAERGSPKYEGGAALAERYLVEGSPRLQHFAEITASLAKLDPLDRG